MTIKLQYISYLILISMFINQGDGRWKERDKEELQKDFTAYKKFKDKLQKHIEMFYKENPRDLLFENEDIRYLKDFELDFFKKALLNSNKNYTETPENNPFNSNMPIKQNNNGFQPINEKRNEFLNKTSKTETKSDHSSPYPGWPKFEDLLRASGKKYDWKNDRWIKVKKKDKVVTVNEDENSIHYYVKHEFRYKILKSNKINKKRRNVVVVTAVR